jgi:predicted ATPase
MRRALLYALTLPQVRGGVLLIDEIESAIHVKALAGVFTWLTNACEQFDVQLFASTHSLEALESLLGDDAQTAARVVGFHLPNRSTGAAATRYEGELLARLVRDRGLDVR